jgi:phosphate transport system permease protein
MEINEAKGRASLGAGFSPFAQRGRLGMKLPHNDKEKSRSEFGGRGDLIASRTVLAVSTAGILLMAFILCFLMLNGLPVLKDAGLKELFFGVDWYPAEEPPALGMLPLIAGTLLATLLSSVLSLPIACALAVFTAEIAPKKARNFLKILLELLGFLPSIVLGFLGMMVLAPWMQNTFNIATGLNLFTASILLGFLVIPVVASLAEEALSSVPHELRDASYALGATRWETVRKVVIPHASSGIIAAALLGVMRALGETMVVLMVAGGAAIFPRSIMDPVRPLTSTIAAEMGETPVGSTHYHALFFAGLILLLITLAINMLSLKIEKGSKE